MEPALFKEYIYIAYQENSGDPISKDAISTTDPVKSLVDHPSSEMARRMDYSHTPIQYQEKSPNPTKPASFSLSQPQLAHYFMSGCLTLTFRIYLLHRAARRWSCTYCDCRTYPDWHCCPCWILAPQL